MAARGFVGAGDLYIERYDPTLPGFLPATGPYNANKFSLGPKSTIKELKSKGRSSYGQVLESVALNEPAEFEVELSEVIGDTLVLALLGSSTALTGAAGTATAETTVGSLTSWTKLAKESIDGDVTLTNTGATVTYVENVDYILNRELGMYKAIATITEAQSLKATYDYFAGAGTRISGAVVPSLRARFTLHGINLADSLPCIVRVREAILAPSSALDFLADDFQKLALKGTLKTPTGFTEPFTVDLRTSAQ